MFRRVGAAIVRICIHLRCRSTRILEGYLEGHSPALSVQVVPASMWRLVRRGRLSRTWQSIIGGDPWSLPDAEVRRELRSAERSTLRAAQPTPDEVDAWASRERMLRQAWLAGPTEDEQHEWACRYRQRATLGFAESRLGASRDEIVEWAQREHKRRQAWLEGPTEQEKQDWARGYRRPRLTGLPESDLPPTDDEISTGRPGTRPSSGVARGAHRRGEAALDPKGARGHLGRRAERLRDRTRAARRGRSSSARGRSRDEGLARAPLAIWSYLVRSGRRVEDDFYQPPPRRRVRF